MYIRMKKVIITEVVCRYFRKETDYTKNIRTETEGESVPLCVVAKRNEWPICLPVSEMIEMGYECIVLRGLFWYFDCVICIDYEFCMIRLI